jgi:hypothetical protein
MQLIMSTQRSMLLLLLLLRLLPQHAVLQVRKQYAQPTACSTAGAKTICPTNSMQ